MMLNILITFAQYEREVITERVRDKMAASRRKGKWVGGSVPMGYDVVNKKLEINPEDAKVIRDIFQRYVEIQSPKLIALELNEKGIKTRQGKIWDMPHINRVLSNHTYVGEVKYQGEICEGEQEAIISRELWDRVKEIQKTLNPQTERTRRQDAIAPLKGVLRCGHCGGAMIPIYTDKGNIRYRYYQCGKDIKRAVSECPVRQIPATDIEEVIKKQLKKMLTDFSLVVRFAEQSGMTPAEVIECFNEAFWNEITPGEYNRLIVLLVEQAVVWEDKLEIELKTSGIKSLVEAFKNE
jgi:site-specific DNA recombinase